jgi:hypothetical protein
LRLALGRPETARSSCWRPGYPEQLKSAAGPASSTSATFNGGSVTLIGPAELATLDKESARQLRRDMRSMITGPRATLVLYEKQFLSARSVGFQPGTREASLVEKLGFGGRVESMQLRCG